jgi:hypothetical protein
MFTKEHHWTPSSATESQYMCWYPATFQPYEVLLSDTLSVFVSKHGNFMFFSNVTISFLVMGNSADKFSDCLI